MKYRINGKIVEKHDFYSQLEDDLFETRHDSYDEQLDEMGDINIGSLIYNVSYVLKNVDEVAYRCGYSEYISFILEELACDFNDYELEHEVNGNTYSTKLEAKHE